MDTQISRVRWDVVAGAAAIALGCVFLLFGSGLAFGTLTDMGPGFFPVCTAVILIMLGTMIAIEGARREPAVPDFPRLRPFLVIVACPIVFAGMIGWAGMVPTVVVTALLARAAEPLEWGWDLLLVPLSLVTLSVLVFIKFLVSVVRTFGADGCLI